MMEQQNQAKLCDKFVATFDILGRKWNGLIIESLLLAGPQRFKDLATRVEACSDRVLVERLKELERANILERKVGLESSRAIYQLTQRGEAMRPVMQSIHEWADEYNH